MATFNNVVNDEASLKYLLDRHDGDTDIEGMELIKHSPYYSESQFKNIFYRIQAFAFYP